MKVSEKTIDVWLTKDIESGCYIAKYNGSYNGQNGSVIAENKRLDKLHEDFENAFINCFMTFKLPLFQFRLLALNEFLEK